MTTGERAAGPATAALSGEVDVELDDGVEVHLKAGDVLAQNGTRHAWRNKSDQLCVLVVTVTGAHRA
jgi:quercetin dioxygenase-like cupin family protein